MRMAMDRLKGGQKGSLFNLAEIDLKDDQEGYADPELGGPQTGFSKEDSVFSVVEWRTQGHSSVTHGHWVEQHPVGSGLWVFTSAATTCASETRTRSCPLTDADQHVLQFMHGLVASDAETGVYAPEALALPLKDDKAWARRGDALTRARECRKKPPPEWCAATAGTDGHLSRSLDGLEQVII